MLWHEYAHALVHDLSHGQAPRWLHEGLLGIADRPGEAVVMPAGQFYGGSHILVRYLLELKGWDLPTLEQKWR